MMDNDKTRFKFLDCFLFNKMIVPLIIKYLYWIFLGVSFIYAMRAPTFGFLNNIQAIIAFVIGAILVRIFFELIIILFKIYEKLSIIADECTKKE